MLCITLRHPLDCGVLYTALQLARTKSDGILYRCDSGWTLLVV